MSATAPAAGCDFCTPQYRARGLARLPGSAVTRWYASNVPAAGGSDSTLADVREPAGANRTRLGRRIALTVLVLVILLAATGFLGVRTKTTTAHGGGYTMSVTYPLIARAGLDVPWRVVVRHPGGFDHSLVIAVSARYFDIFETQGFHPQPSGEARDGRLLYLTFDPPPTGEVFAVDYDAYIQPASQVGRHADTELIIGGHPLATASYTTWLVP
jgi:hypothetical protein